MTLHWWMHWFWITSLAVSVCICSPTLPTLQTTDLQPPSPSVQDTDDSTSKGGFSFIPIATTSPLPVRGHRGGKAIGQPPPNPSTVLPYFKVSISFPLATGSDVGDEGPPLQKELALNLDYKKPPRPTTEIKTASITTVPKIEEKNITEPTILTETETEASTNLEITLNNTSADVTVPNSVVNSSNVTLIGYNNTVNDSVVKVIEDVTEEPVKNNTTGVEISTARALLLETGVGRRAADSDVSKSQVTQGTGGLDAGAVSGICFGILVVLGLGGAISLVLYRRRYLNKPQTLNDKCSNPDSSGYIDDSTIRENSEEMYSLDNDSFLNSLEAMTIQNYWTDSVKHTKL